MSYETRVYKIWYEDTPEEIYIGSTKNKLSTRMKNHRCAARRGDQPQVYQTMRAKGINNFKYAQIASCMVSNKDEQRAFEQQMMEKLKPTLNMNKAYLSDEARKQYYAKYQQQHPEKKNIYFQTPEWKEYQREYHSKYKLDNQDKLNAYSKEYNKSIRVNCACGGRYIDMPSHRNKHFQSNLHTKFTN